MNPYEQQMPRGTGFAEQGGYEGQVYNTPQPMPQPQPMSQPMPPPLSAMDMMRGGSPTGGGFSEPAMQPAQLTPEQIQEFQMLLHQQRMQEFMQQQNLQGMLGQQ